MFRTSDRPGFQMTFKNGWTISVQWHTGAYCERRNLNMKTKPWDDRSAAASKDAEVAIWNSQGDWYDFGGAQVKGYCSVDEVLEWMNKAASM